ncbi:MAG: chromate efflux transporter [Acidobacteriota bacterium]
MGGRLPEATGNPIRELAFLFLKLGTVAFGGPAAHVAMMEDEVVRRRRWLTREEFLDLFGATHLIPGPNSTELAIHIGHRRGGWTGLLVAGSCFILPAMVIVTVLAWAYVRFGTLPEVERLLYGVKPVVLVIIFQALLKLGRTALRSWRLGLVAAVAAGLTAVGCHELLILLGTGLAVAAARLGARAVSRGVGHRSLLLLPGLSWMPAATASTPFGLGALFLFFLKVGSVLFGSGYVLLAFLRADLVDRWHWLTETQLLDAVAIGQVTPGPLFTTATFIGYLLGGLPGALVATAGIFLPAFVFVAVSGPLVPRLRQSALAGAFLDGVNTASLALMAVVTLQLAGAAFVSLFSLVLGAGAAFLLFRRGWSSIWLVLGGAVLGLLAGKVGL